LNAVLIFDADNTLWDSNTIFVSAQMALLKQLTKVGLITKPDSEYNLLRTLDREFINKTGNFEYDFKYLALALVYYYSNSITTTEAVQFAISQNGYYDHQQAITVEESHHAYLEALKVIPSLYPETEAVLRSINALKLSGYPVVRAICSEGNPIRLEKTLQAHQIREQKYFDEIIMSRKSKESLQRAKEVALTHLPEQASDALIIMIGDSLQRDIKPSNQLGFITIYKPAAFLGEETPRELDERPCYVIRTLGELPMILRDLGIPL